MVIYKFKINYKDARTKTLNSNKDNNTKAKAKEFIKSSNKIASIELIKIEFNTKGLYKKITKVYVY